MSFEFLCEACGATLRIDDDLAGKQVKCPQCSAVVPAKAAGEAASASPFGQGGLVPPRTDDMNPYASPTAPPVDDPAPPAGGGKVVTPRIRRAMSQTRPWVLFVAILGFLAGGLMLVATVVMAIASLVAGEPEMLIVAPFYCLYGALYLGCAYYLLLYGRRIGRLEQTCAVFDLEEALVAQKSFWRLVGVTLAVMLSLGLVMMVGFVILGAVMAGMG